MQLDHIRFAKTPFYFWPIMCFLPNFEFSISYSCSLSGAPWDSQLNYSETFLIFNPAKLFFVRNEQKRQNKVVSIKKRVNFARIWLISVNKVPRLRTRHNLLKIQNWVGNTEKLIIGQKYNEDFANLMWSSCIIWTLIVLIYQVWETSRNKLKKHSVTKNCSDLSLFE